MQYIIDFKNSTTQQEIEQYLLDEDCLVIRTFDAYNKVYLVEALSRPQETDIIEYIVDDEANPLTLLSVEYSANGSGVKYDMVSFANDDDNWWKVASSFAPDLEQSEFSVERRGSAATVYIVDSGIQASHPEFSGVDISTIYTFNGNDQDVNGHGTAIASIIAGNTCGIASPKIRALKVFEKGTPTLQSHLLAALDTILNDWMSNPKTFPIVNLSWSIPKNTYIESKIQVLIDAGMVVVAAAGNSGVPIEDVTPASMSQVCTVGAYDQDFTPADFSNYTGAVSNTENQTNSGALDVWAPGVLIRAAKLDGTLSTTAGTSMAAAIHTAAVAYNCSNFTLSDGSVPDTVRLSPHYIASSSISNRGILILSDKYESSINATSIFNTKYDGDGGTSLSSAKKINLAVKSGDLLEKIILRDLVSDKIVLNDPLPAGFTIDNGWLRGRASVDQTVVFSTSTSYVTHGGREIHGQLTLVILAENETIEDSSIDPELKMTLLDTCGVTGSPGAYFCGGNCATTGGICEDACKADHGPKANPGAFFCYCTGAGTLECP